jgi:hypothetical protein
MSHGSRHPSALGERPPVTSGGPPRTGRPRWTVLALVLTMLAVLGASASVGHQRWSYAGQPASPQEALPIDRVLWVWTGAVTTTTATVVAEIVRPARLARLTVSTRHPGRPILTPAETVGPDGVVRFQLTHLAPDLDYHYTIEVDETIDHSRGSGRFRTMPHGPASFTVAVSSCADTGSSGAVFDAIRAVHPLLYINAGDLHYGNPRHNDVTTFGDLYRRTLTAPAQAALYRSVPIAYVWDDHDYGPNNADAAAPTRQAARTAYATYVPHYPRPAPGQAVYQAFTIGRVRFILTDNRSERTAATMLGPRQLAWLQQELTSASGSHALVVWINPDPRRAASDRRCHRLRPHPQPDHGVWRRPHDRTRRRPPQRLQHGRRRRVPGTANRSTRPSRQRQRRPVQPRHIPRPRTVRHHHHHRRRNRAGQHRTHRPHLEQRNPPALQNRHRSTQVIDDPLTCKALGTGEL